MGKNGASWISGGNVKDHALFEMEELSIHIGEQFARQERVKRRTTLRIRPKTCAISKFTLTTRKAD